MRERGVMLIVVLGLGLFFLVLGMGFLSQRAEQYKGAYRLAESEQALAIARAGLEDARVKLSVDPGFPPQGSVDQSVFSYSENLTEVGGTAVVGSYTVTVDRRHALPPYSVVRLTIVGKAGPPDSPLARRVLSAELDVAAFLRDDPDVTNPEFFNFIQIVDQGSL